MNDMVSQVVQVLDEGNPFMSPTRVLHSRVKKLQPRRKPIRPAKTTGELDGFVKHKEQQRKQAKDTHPNVSLKWDARLTKRYTPKVSNFAISFVDKTLINQ
jgi:hypothetical protein